MSTKTPSIKAPFANESETFDFRGATVENRTDRIAIYGDLEITRDQAGLEKARVLKALLDSVVKTLEAEPNLPSEVGPPTDVVVPSSNPFA